MLDSKIFKLTRFHKYLIERFKPTRKDIIKAVKNSETYSSKAYPSKSRASSKSKSKN